MVAALERSQARVAELEREAGTYAERMAGLDRVRDAAMAHAAELEAKLEAAAAQPPDPEPAPDPFPEPIPPMPNAVPWDARWQARVTIAAALLIVALTALVAAPAWVR